MKKKRFPLLIAAIALSLVLSGTTKATAADNTQLVVADAAMYRGTITSIVQTEDIFTFALTQEEGTDFGYPSLHFETNEYTKSETKFEDFKVGDYLEVFYNTSNAKKLQRETAISINKLLNASDCLFHGTVIEVTSSSKKENAGSILMKNAKNQETIFHYDEETQCYLDIAKAKNGDMLNIYHKGIFTKSIPPQGSTLEIRKSSETLAYRGVLTKVKSQKNYITLTLKKTADSTLGESFIKVNVRKTTKTNISSSKLKKGMYLEVSYPKSKSTPTAITMQQLTDKSELDFHGIITEIRKDETKVQTGSITVTDFDGNFETIFHYSSETKFHSSIIDLKKGSKIYIRHTPAFTLSLPPQGAALEISLYR